MANPANASLISALGGQVVNDTDRNITWLANANLADTQDFGVSGVAANGTMNWNTANLWIAAMNSNNYLGFNNWRLPNLVDTGTPGCNFAYSGSDCGINVNTTLSEIAHLYYDELGNKAYADTSGNPQAGGGLTNTDPFSNFNSTFYWYGTENAANTNEAWRFLTINGDQNISHKTLNHNILAVRTGLVEVAPVSVPEPMTLALFGLGLAGLGWSRRR